MEGTTQAGQPPQLNEQLGAGESSGDTTMIVTDLNRAIPTAILGGLLSLTGEQMRDPEVGERIVDAIRENS